VNDVTPAISDNHQDRVLVNKPIDNISLSTAFITLSKHSKNFLPDLAGNFVLVIAKRNGDVGAEVGKRANHQEPPWQAVKRFNVGSEKERLIPYCAVHDEPIRIETAASSIDWNANGYRMPIATGREKTEMCGLVQPGYPPRNSISRQQAKYPNITLYYHDGIFTDAYHPNHITKSNPISESVGNTTLIGYGFEAMAGNINKTFRKWYTNYCVNAPPFTRATSRSYGESGQRKNDQCSCQAKSSAIFSTNKYTESKNFFQE
jgi:hypothetical protein